MCVKPLERWLYFSVLLFYCRWVLVWSSDRWFPSSLSLSLSVPYCGGTKGRSISRETSCGLTFLHHFRVMKIWKKSDKIFWVLNHIGSTFGYLIQVEFLDFNLYKRLNIEFVYYSRKLQHRSKIHAEGRRNTETENRKPSDA